jgi:hypothetical protein
VNTVNTTEHPQGPAEEPASPDEATESPVEEPRDRTAEPEDEEEQVPAAEPEGGEEQVPAAEPEGGEEQAPAAEQAPTAIYVRRGRTPALGFWVVLCFLVPAVAALLAAPFLQFGDLRGVVNFVLLAMVVVGLPLAAIASFIDARRHRGEGRGRR